MAENNKGTPWVQSNLGAGVVAAVVGLALGVVVNAIFDGMIWWLRIAVVAGAVVIGLVLFSAINEKWRERIWARLGRWIRGLRPVTIARLRREVAAERSAVEKEHAEATAERQKSPSPPQWVIRYDRRMGRDEFDNDTFWLTNMGFPVREVEVTGDPEFIELPHRVIFQAHDHGTGQWFAADITERGRREGVTLTITHLNRHGDPGTFDYRLEPDVIGDMKLETRDDAYTRGRADGRAEGHAAGVEAGRQALQSEIDTQRAKPVRKPRWAILQKPDGDWTLANTSEGAVATVVTLDAPPNQFTFYSAADWDDMSGVSVQGFRGLAVGAGVHVAFTVEWNDVNGIRQTSPIHWYPEPPTYAGPFSVGGGDSIGAF